MADVPPLPEILSPLTRTSLFDHMSLCLSHWKALALWCEQQLVFDMVTEEHYDRLSDIHHTLIHFYLIHQAGLTKYTCPATVEEDCPIWEVWLYVYARVQWVRLRYRSQTDTGRLKHIMNKATLATWLPLPWEDTLAETPIGALMNPLVARQVLRCVYLHWTHIAFNKKGRQGWDVVECLWLYHLLAQPIGLPSLTDERRPYLEEDGQPVEHSHLYTLKDKCSLMGMISSTYMTEFAQAWLTRCCPLNMKASEAAYAAPWSKWMHVLIKRGHLDNELAVAYVQRFLEFRCAPADTMYYTLIRPHGPFAMEDILSCLYSQAQYRSWFEVDGNLQLAELVNVPTTPGLTRFWAFSLLVHCFLINHSEVSLLNQWIVDGPTHLFTAEMDLLLQEGPMILVFTSGAAVISTSYSAWCPLATFPLLPWIMWYAMLLEPPYCGNIQECHVQNVLMKEWEECVT